MSSACIDSNVIIKYYIGDLDAKKVLEPILNGEVTGFINNIIFSEVVFVLVKLLTDMKAYELKRNPQLVKDTFKTINKQIAFLLARGK